MKKIYILSALAVSLIFAGCSEFEAPDENKNQKDSLTGVTTTLSDVQSTSGISGGTTASETTSASDVTTNINSEIAGTGSKTTTTLPESSGSDEGKLTTSITTTAPSSSGTTNTSKSGASSGEANTTSKKPSTSISSTTTKKTSSANKVTTTTPRVTTTKKPTATSKITTTTTTTKKPTTTTKLTTTTKKPATTTKLTTTTTKKPTTTTKITTTTKKTTTTKLTTTTKKTTTTTKKPTTTTTTTTTSGGSGSSGVKLPYDATTNAYINEVARLTNEFRAENGVAPLTLDLNLTKVAMVRGNEIVELFSHTRPDGTECFTAFEEGGFNLGVNCWNMGENIAYGYRSPEAVVNGWINSEGHRANMLSRHFDTIGIGFVVDKNGTYYWTQQFVGIEYIP